MCIYIYMRFSLAEGEMSLISAKSYAWQKKKRTVAKRWP